MAHDVRGSADQLVGKNFLLKRKQVLEENPVTGSLVEYRRQTVKGSSS